MDGFQGVAVASSVPNGVVAEWRPFMNTRQHAVGTRGFVTYHGEIVVAGVQLEPTPAGET